MRLGGKPAMDVLGFFGDPPQKIHHDKYKTAFLETERHMWARDSKDAHLRSLLHTGLALPLQRAAGLLAAEAGGVGDCLWGAKGRGGRGTEGVREMGGSLQHPAERPPPLAHRAPRGRL